jgi:hypothetical protein
MLVVSETTNVADLVGCEFSTEHIDPFEIVSADQAPDLAAICYSARDVEQGYLFVAFLPWGKALLTRAEAGR